VKDIKWSSKPTAMSWIKFLVYALRINRRKIKRINSLGFNRMVKVAK